MIAHFATARAQARWDNLIKRQGDRGALRQNGIDRAISVSIQQEKPMERLGGISNPLDRTALVSALDPDTGIELSPPPSERDVLVLDADFVMGFHDQFGDIDQATFKIIAPPDSMGASAHTLYWRIKVRR